MALTKVSGGILDPGISVAGVVTATGFSGPFIGSGGVNAGVVTATGLDVNGNGDISGNLVIGGNLTANGDFTTLNTTLREVELLRVDANSSVAAGIITQTGAGDLLRLYDGTSQVVTVDDEGNVGLGSAIPAANLDLNGTFKIHDGSGYNNHITYHQNPASIRFPTGPLANLAKTPYLGFGDRTAGGDFKIYHDYYNTHLKLVGLGGLHIGNTSGVVQINGANGSGGTRSGVVLTAGNEGVKLYHGSTAVVKFETVGYGVTVYGTTETQQLNVTGVSTFSDNITIPDNKKLILGSLSGRQLHLYHNTSGSSNHVIESTSSSNHLVVKATTINPRSDYYSFRNYAHNQNVFLIDADGATTLFFNGNEKLTTTGYGVTVTGITSATSFIASESGVNGEYSRNQIKWDRNSYNYIDCTNNSGQLAIRMGSSQTTAFSIDTNADTLFPTNRKIKMGSSGNSEIYSNNSHLYVTDNAAGYLHLQGNYGVVIQRHDGSENMIRALSNGAVELFYDESTYSTPKLKTTATGVTVDGEVVASQDYPNIRPVLDFNFAATKKLKPEMTFTRQGEASFHDGVGSVKFVSDNEPRFEHDILTGECKGLMFEQAGTNYSWYSRRFDAVNTGSWVKVTGNLNVVANSYTAPDGTSSGVFMADTISGANGTTFNGNVMRQQVTAGAGVKHTFSIYVKLLTSTQATIYVRDGQTGSTSTASAVNIKGWQRLVVTSTNALTNGIVHSFYVGNTNGDIAVWGSQIERSDYVTSYIKTDTGVNGTRTADNGGVRLDGEDVTDVFNDGKGTLIAEVIPTIDETNQTAVGFYQDFGDVNRIELRTQSTNSANARFESVVNSSSVVNMTSSAHAGINNVSKYAFAFQRNNYASTVNGGSVYTDTNGAFPSGMNSMIIGDAVYTKDQSMIIKRIMYYADRLPNSQLVTLTS